MLPLLGLHIKKRSDVPKGIHFLITKLVPRIMIYSFVLFIITIEPDLAALFWSVPSYIEFWHWPEWLFIAFQIGFYVSILSAICNLLFNLFFTCGRYMTLTILILIIYYVLCVIVAPLIAGT